MPTISNIEIQADVKATALKTTANTQLATMALLRSYMTVPASADLFYKPT